MTRLFLFLLVVLISADAVSQKKFTNGEGHYSFVPLSGWTTRTDGSESYVYAPADGDMDPWDEKITFSTSLGEGVELNDAFDFYLNTDFPELYSGFKIVDQGSEQINGVPARWMTFTFSAQGTAAGGTGSGDSILSATLQALFYVVKKGDSLYLINGVTEKSLFARFDSPFRTIIRTFRAEE